MVLNDLDRIILIIVGIGACIGLYRGFFREAIGIAGIVLAAIAANLASPFTKPYASSFIESDTIASIVVWVIVFFFSMFLLNRLAVLLDHFMDSISLGWINRLAGGLIGALKFCIIVALIISLLEVITAHVEIEKLKQYLETSSLVPRIHQLIDVITPWASEHILKPTLELLNK